LFYFDFAFPAGALRLPAFLLPVPPKADSDLRINTCTPSKKIDLLHRYNQARGRSPELRAAGVPTLSD
jgi:hypothetical protein